MRKDTIEWRQCRLGLDDDRSSAQMPYVVKSLKFSLKRRIGGSSNRERLLSCSDSGQKKPQKWDDFKRFTNWNISVHIVDSKFPYDSSMVDTRTSCIYLCYYKNIMAQLLLLRTWLDLTGYLGKSSLHDFSPIWRQRNKAARGMDISRNQWYGIFDLALIEWNKIEGWQNTTYCFFCGFPYKKK